ncbi:MAG: hypothetical protein FWF41_07530 [Betaproteobacteria bacterium]|nr:hypothetical protein [Betaproteobacteria bacterium]
MYYTSDFGIIKGYTRKAFINEYSKKVETPQGLDFDLHRRKRQIWRWCSVGGKPACIGLYLTVKEAEKALQGKRLYEALQRVPWVTRDFDYAAENAAEYLRYESDEDIEKALEEQPTLRALVAVRRALKNLEEAIKIFLKD